MSDIQLLTQKILEFRDARDWKQFHNPKDLAMSLVLEAGEVMEHFQWKGPEATAVHIEEHRADIGEELADTLYWVLLLAHDLNIDLVGAFNKKMEKNNLKYPVEKAHGSALKYTQLV